MLDWAEDEARFAAPAFSPDQCACGVRGVRGAGSQCGGQCTELGAEC